LTSWRLTQGPNRTTPPTRRAWIYLVTAGILEIGWAIGLKYTESFSRLWPSVLTVAAMIASFVLLAQALKIIPAGTALSGMAPLGESREPLRLLCLALIVAGVVGLKVASALGH
jgi:quaternary ammonium compound-resistance protein SugE